MEWGLLGIGRRVRRNARESAVTRRLLALLAAVGFVVPWFARRLPSSRPASRPTSQAVESPTEQLRGLPIEDVRVLGNSQVSTAVILNVIRTREGEPYDPATVEEDYQRVYNLRRFSNVI